MLIKQPGYIRSVRNKVGDFFILQFCDFLKILEIFQILCFMYNFYFFFWEGSFFKVTYVTTKVTTEHKNSLKWAKTA